MNQNDEHPLIHAGQLEVHFPLPGFFWPRPRPVVKAVRGVDLHIHQGETLGLVGESGCGKSTLGRALVGLLAGAGGHVDWRGKDLKSLNFAAKKEFKKKVQMVFQDPYGSLNPRFTIENLIGEGLDIHRLTSSKSERREKILDTLIQVGLEKTALKRYPHEFSGGQRQRVGIARALVMRPELIVCDEPVSALDVSIQAQIITLLKDIQKSFNIAYLFIAHDLAVVANISHRIAVMYLGKIVEEGTTEQLIKSPAHPYTKLLLETAPSLTQNKMKDSPTLPAGNLEPPSPIRIPPGCSFHPRCPIATDLCRKEVPVPEKKLSGARVACHHAE